MGDDNSKRERERGKECRYVFFFLGIGVMFVVCMQMVKREAGIRAKERKKERKKEKVVPARSRNKKKGARRQHPTEG